MGTEYDSWKLAAPPVEDEKDSPTDDILRRAIRMDPKFADEIRVWVDQMPVRPSNPILREYYALKLIERAAAISSADTMFEIAEMVANEEG